MPVDPNCGNCDGRGCMGCVCREYDHDCADDCPVCCPEYGGDLEAFLIAENARVRGLEEDNKRLVALVRAKDEAIGELLDQVTCRGHYEWRKWWDEEDQCLSGGFFPVNS